MTVLSGQRALIDQEHIVLSDVSWVSYEKLLEEVGDRAVKLTYWRGMLEIMAPWCGHFEDGLRGSRSSNAIAGRGAGA